MKNFDTRPREDHDHNLNLRPLMSPTRQATLDAQALREKWNEWNRSVRLDDIAKRTAKP